MRKYWYTWVHGALHIAFFTNEFIIARADTDNKGFIKTISEPSHCVLLVLGIKCSKFIWSDHCEPDTIKNKISKPVKKKRSRLDQNRSRSDQTSSFSSSTLYVMRHRHLCLTHRSGFLIGPILQVCFFGIHIWWIEEPVVNYKILEAFLAWYFLFSTYSSSKSFDKDHIVKMSQNSHESCNHVTLLKNIFTQVCSCEFK